MIYVYIHTYIYTMKVLLERNYHLLFYLSVCNVYIYPINTRTKMNKKPTQDKQLTIKLH